MKIKGILIFVSIIFLLFTFFSYRQKALEFKFVDEEDNFTFGKYLTQGEKLYDDLITNHQPLTHILSAQIQTVTKPENVYLLLTRHRAAIALYSILWSVILIYYFGLAAVFFVVIYELTKILLLGNLFLAESLVVYPLLFLAGTTLITKKSGNFRIFLWGLSFSFCIFLLGPILPAILFLLIIQLFKVKANYFNFLKFSIWGFLLPTLLVLKYISLGGYLYYYYFVNATYTVPGYQNDPIFVSILKSCATPIIALFTNNQSTTLLIIKLTTLIFSLNLIVLNNWKKATLVFIFFGLLNLRFVIPGTESYSGFHFLPWYASFIFINILIIGKKFRIFYLSIIALIIMISFKSSDLFKKDNSLSSYYTNYSTHIAVGDKIKQMKNSGDTLFVSPNAWLIYWQADVNHIPKLYGDYTWMAGFPPLQQKVLESFEKNPPRFFYCENCNGLSLEKYLVKYKRIENSFLYVLSK